MNKLTITNNDLDSDGFYKKQDLIFDGNIVIECDYFKLNGNLYCKGDLYCEGNLYCKGNIDCKGNLYCKGDLHCKGNIDCEGYLYCKGNIDCEGYLHCKSSLYCEGYLYCNGEAKVKGMKMKGKNWYVRLNGCVGSHRSPLIAYKSELGVFVKKGCFFGKLEELMDAVEMENSGNYYQMSHFSFIVEYLKQWGELV